MKKNGSSTKSEVERVKSRTGLSAKRTGAASLPDLTRSPMSDGGQLAVLLVDQLGAEKYMIPYEVAYQVMAPTLNGYIQAVKRGQCYTLPDGDCISFTCETHRPWEG